MFLQYLFQITTAKTGDLPFAAGLKVVRIQREFFILDQTRKLNDQRQGALGEDIVFCLELFQPFFRTNHYMPPPQFWLKIFLQ